MTRAWRLFTLQLNGRPLCNGWGLPHPLWSLPHPSHKESRDKEWSKKQNTTPTRVGRLTQHEDLPPLLCLEVTVAVGMYAIGTQYQLHLVVEVMHIARRPSQLGKLIEHPPKAIAIIKDGHHLFNTFPHRNLVKARAGNFL